MCWNDSPDASYGVHRGFGVWKECGAPGPRPMAYTGGTPTTNLGGPRHVGNMCWNDSPDASYGVHRGFGYWKPCS
jgi:hypothetical protein